MSKSTRVVGGSAVWPNDADWNQQGELNNYAWFGRDVTCVVNSTTKNTLLLIGAAEWADPTRQASAVGKLFGYQFNWGTTLTSKLLFSIIGEYKFDKVSKIPPLTSPHLTSHHLTHSSILFLVGIFHCCRIALWRPTDLCCCLDAHESDTTK